MTVNGVILAPTVEFGKILKGALGLKYWFVASPHSLRLGRCRGISSEPRLILAPDVASDPPYVMFDLAWPDLVLLFEPNYPEIFVVKHAVDLR